MKRVAFLSFDWDYKIISEYYFGLQERLAAHRDVQLVIFNAFERYYSSLRPKESSFQVLSLCDLEKYDGFLIQGNRSWPPALRQRVVEDAVALGKPIVSINYDLAGAHTVGTDNYQAEYDLIERVLSDHGCHKPAFVNGLRTSGEAQARAQAFRDACEHHGIKDVRFYQANWQKEAGIATADKLLRQPHDLPDVVFCCNDDLALGVQETLLAAGVRVPEDVMVTGFDNRVISREATPRITTIDRDYRTIAATALDTILDLLDGADLPMSVASPVRHILSESCGYPTIDEREASDDGLEVFYTALMDFQSAAFDADSLYGVLECCERFLPRLGCANTFVSLNSLYRDAHDTRKANVYGPTSYLVAKSGQAVHLACDNDHIYAPYATKELLPSVTHFDGSLYLVSPLRHGETCIGTLVTEGVPLVERHGLLAFFLGILSGSIDIVKKTKLLREAQALRSSE